MNKKTDFFPLHSFFSCLILAWLCGFSYSYASLGQELTFSRATFAAQQEKWDEAQALMQSLLVDNPDRYDLLYDLGVASFKQKEFEQARAYFQKVVEGDHAFSDLKRKARFNLANTFVELKKLDNAIAQYKAIVKNFPDDTRAKHNLKLVERASEEQKKQEKKEKGNKQGSKDSDKQEDSKDGQQSKDAQSSDSDQNNNDQGQRSKPESEQKKESNSNDSKNSSPKKEKGEKSNSGQQDRQEQSAQQKKDNPKSSGQKNEQPQAHGKPDKPEEHNDQGYKQNQGHKSEPHQESQSKKLDDKDKKGRQKEQAIKGKVGKASDSAGLGSKEEDVPELAAEDRWILGILDQCEKNDEQIGKKLIKGTIDKKMAGKNGQNCW